MLPWIFLWLLLIMGEAVSWDLVVLSTTARDIQDGHSLIPLARHTRVIFLLYSAIAEHRVNNVWL